MKVAQLIYCLSTVGGQISEHLECLKVYWCSIYLWILFQIQCTLYSFAKMEFIPYRCPLVSIKQYTNHDHGSSALTNFKLYAGESYTHSESSETHRMMWEGFPLIQTLVTSSYKLPDAIILPWANEDILEKLKMMIYTGRCLILDWVMNSYVEVVNNGNFAIWCIVLTQSWHSELNRTFIKRLGVAISLRRGVG